MIDARKIDVRSIEELIEVLHPVEVSAIHADRFEVAYWELRQMRSNISAVLSYTSSSSLAEPAERDAELRRVVDEVRRECLVINGMISRLIFRKRWLFSTGSLEDAKDALSHYQNMTAAACRMCLLVAPERGNELLSVL